MKPRTYRSSPRNDGLPAAVRRIALTVLLTNSLWSADHAAKPVPENALATILETKIVCKEPGRVAGEGTEYGVNANGHLVIKKQVTESDRYLGWGTLAKLRDGELILAFSGDRDAHVCPWGKTQIVRSTDRGKTWSAGPSRSRAWGPAAV